MSLIVSSSSLNCVLSSNVSGWLHWTHIKDVWTYFKCYPANLFHYLSCSGGREKIEEIPIIGKGLFWGNGIEQAVCYSSALHWFIYWILVYLSTETWEMVITSFCFWDLAKQATVHAAELKTGPNVHDKVQRFCLRQHARQTATECVFNLLNQMARWQWHYLIVFFYVRMCARTSACARGP